MKKQDTSLPQKKQKAVEKKLRKSERQLKGRLQAAQNAQGRATQRLRRAEARVQKIMVRAKRMEERLIEVRLQIEGVRDGTGSGVVGLLIIPPQEPPLAGENVVLQEPLQAGENVVAVQGEAQEARTAAEAVEQEVRDAVERAQSITTSADIEQREEVSQPLPEEHAGYPTPEDFARVEAITLAEENIEIAASMSAADAAGAAAATAEALAEASSVRAEEARRIAQQADHFLEQVRNAVRDGAMQGEEAERAMSAAENEATYAHALLADAEVAEEQARNEAMNAEAEAEVAEGMSQSANAHARDTITNFDQESAGHTNGVAAASDVRDEAIVRTEVGEDEDDGTNDTDELPTLHQREQE